MPRRGRGLCAALITAAALVVVPTRQATAHDGLHERLARATARIDAAPTDGALYLARAELHRQHADWDAAGADLERAATHAGDPDAIALLRARVLLGAGCPRTADVILERLVARRPDWPAAHETRGVALEALARPADAARAYASAVRVSARPQPDLFRRWSGAAAAAGDLAGALAALDAGVKRLGPIVALLEPAIALERTLDRYDAALRRIDDIMARAQRHERWLALRADVLDDAGRPRAARLSRRAALAAIRALPPTRRGAPIMQDLERVLRARLAQSKIDGDAR